MKFSTFKYHSGILYGGTPTFTSIDPDSGPSTGGQDFVIIGDAMLFETYDDTFAILSGAKWTDASVGGGSVATGSSHLQLNTGAVAGGHAIVESLAAVNSDVQFEVKVNIPPQTIRPTSDVILFGLSLYIDANNAFNIGVIYDSTGAIQLRCYTYVGSTIRSSQSIDWTTGISTFKILRFYSDVYFYANGSLVFFSKEGKANTDAFIRMGSSNGASNYDIVNVVVEYIVNRPFVVFDDQVVHDTIAVSDTRLRGHTPPSMSAKDISAAFAGLVTVYVCSSDTLVSRSAYEYYFVDDLILNDDTQFSTKLGLIGDSTVRTPTGYTRGLGEGR
jgi:hypothetical protein